MVTIVLKTMRKSAIAVLKMYLYDFFTHFLSFTITRITIMFPTRPSTRAKLINDIRSRKDVNNESIAFFLSQAVAYVSIDMMFKIL